ncbi:thioredoxin domain-containing protein [Couchioplanes azureus]|uniref:hypothetical protein n=1 Tax=Couchioplanes caeruleus TaxID=56438 RepID=UPI00166F6D0B|nr:hypothetical protein [Couchioplanes caeruleus]GGQ60206.1 hypothetical protein GCM10010166_32270 [Couchioplanes caeruleus subsp. azureus]
MGFLWVVVAALSLLVVVCLLALVDQYRSLEVIRTALGLEDNPTPIPFRADGSIKPSRVGLPPRLDEQPHLAVLFLSVSCTTCRSIAQGLGRKDLPYVWIVLQQARSAAQGRMWLEGMNLPLDRATVDTDERVARAVGIEAVPSVVLYRSGEAVLAQTLPSLRQLQPLLSPRTTPSIPPVAKEGTVRP